jgi:hypothetical protein
MYMHFACADTNICQVDGAYRPAAELSQYCIGVACNHEVIVIPYSSKLFIKCRVK